MAHRRPSTSLLISLAVHAVAIFVFVQALILPRFDVFGRRQRPPENVTERIGYVTLPRATDAGPPVARQVGGNGRPITREHPVPFVAPKTIPSTLPTPPVGAPKQPEAGTGPVVGGGGPLEGVEPRYTDPKLWRPPGPAPAGPPKTPVQRLDSVIADAIGAYNDSVGAVAAARGRDPTDWTMNRNGQKYGIDQRYIHIGPISIPTAILALLPLNISNSPTASTRERDFTRNHDEIFANAQRAMNNADFGKAVRSIEKRKDRERRERALERARLSDTAGSASAAGNP